ncbi:MAG TPA: DNA mismatch repair protein MutS [Acidobacteriota bacterium]|nr:DNA mismatch repair protein MutS [Acidobacteriota bacterium]
MNPVEAYQERLGKRRQAAAELQQREERFSTWRLLAGGGILAAIWISLGPQWFAPVWIFLPSVILIVLIVAHARLRQDLAQARRAADFYRQGLERLNLDESGEAGEGAFGEADPAKDGRKRQRASRSKDQGGLELMPSGHLYASDLDLFGPGSIFQLLSSARTRSGEETLAHWLCRPASPEVVRSRQEAVRDMRPRLDLREDLAVLEAEVEERADPSRLIAWAQRPAPAAAPWLRLLAPLLVVITLVTIAVSITYELGPWPSLAALLVQGAFGLALRKRSLEAIEGIDQPSSDLQLLSKVLKRMEDEAFESDHLQDLHRRLMTEGKTPSQQIERLALLMELLDSRRNQMFIIFAYALLWTTQLALALEEWRRRCGPSIADWLEALGEMEALSSLAGFAFENPQAPFPEILEADAGPHFEGVDLKHPLLGRDRCVPNSVLLGHELRLMVVSGSNMSGKTTLLRTVGVNAVLALAGAPVAAKSLRISPLVLGATLRVQDSLQEGKSRFYAEITRLRRIFDLARRGRPLLFLLDEVLHGTNSHDRAIGAEGVLRALVDNDSIGLVTTHDLALAKVAESMGDKAANVHFEDHLEDGTLVFDHKLRPGVTKKSNALELMRSVGLKV